MYLAWPWPWPTFLYLRSTWAATQRDPMTWTLIYISDWTLSLTHIPDLDLTYILDLNWPDIKHDHGLDLYTWPDLDLHSLNPGQHDLSTKGTLWLELELCTWPDLDLDQSRPIYLTWHPPDLNHDLYTWADTMTIYLTWLWSWLWWPWPSSSSFFQMPIWALYSVCTK
jgi:hypothetical protein